MRSPGLVAINVLNAADFVWCCWPDLGQHCHARGVSRGNKRSSVTSSVGEKQASKQGLRRLMSRRRVASGGTSVAIVGAGLAGLALVARSLLAGRANSASTVRVFEKHHCAGGRLSTRKEADGRFVFDHGAQFFTAPSQ